MGDYSDRTITADSKHKSQDVDRHVCPVCNGRKYTLVETRRMNSSSAVYERQTCQACANEEDFPPVTSEISSSKTSRKTQSGTGYLRNKKRRRKEGN